jgi:hypothetical protein
MLNKLDISDIKSSRLSPKNNYEFMSDMDNYKNGKRVSSLERPSMMNQVKPMKLKTENFPTLDNSNQSNTTNLIKFLNEMYRQEGKFLSYEEYGNFIIDSMAKYQTERYDEVDGPLLDQHLTLNEETIIKSIFRSGVNSKRQMLQGISEDSNLKVIVSDPEYKNPFESFKSLKNNKKIHEFVTTSFMKRQELIYKNAMEKIEKEKMKFIVKMPKIKITTLIPKIFFEFRKTNKFDDSNEEELKKKKNNRHKGEKNEPVHSDLRQDGDLKLFGYYKYCNKNFPEGREQFALDINMNKIILWGGMSSSKNIDIWSLNSDTLEWTRNVATNIYPPNARFGHTGVINEKKFYVFGGKSKNINYSYLADLEVYDIEEKSWNSPIMHTTGLKVRRNHIALMIANHMLIHGGVTENNDFLNDIFLLGFHPFRWTQCSVSDDIQGPNLAGHACALVIPREILYHPKFYIYRYPEVGIGKVSLSRVD